MAQRTRGAFGRITGLFGAAFVVTLVVLTLLGTYGLPTAIVGTILGGALLVTFAAVGIGAGTIQPSVFYAADGGLPPAVNGVAGATAILTGTVFLGLAGTAFDDLTSAAAFGTGLALGLLILAVAIAPYVRKSGAMGIADFLGLRLGGRAVRIAAAAVVATALLPALAAAIATAAELTSALLGVGGGTALTIIATLILTGTMLGGLRGVTLTALVQYVVMAVAFLAPVVVASVRATTVPLPQFTFGYALADAAAEAQALGGDFAAALPRQFLTLAPGHAVATLIAVAAGIAVLPHLVLRNAAVASADGARRSAVWALVFVLLVILAAPAYAAFTHLTLIRDYVGSAISGLPDWVFTFGGAGLVQLCGADATSPVAAIAACGRDTLQASDLALSGDAIVLAAPAIFGLPATFSALIAAGALSAALAAGSAMAIAISNALGHDVYGAIVDPRASAGRRLLVTRVALLATVAIAMFLGTHAEDAMRALALTAISVSAGALFPATILAIWWKRGNAVGGLAAIVAGGIVTWVVALGHLFPDPAIPGPLDWLHLNELTGALAGMVAGFIAGIAGSLLSAAPDARRRAIAEAVRLPGGQLPNLQESDPR